MTRHFLGLVYEHYKSEDSAIDSILLGISGDYGEAIFPCIGNFDGQDHLHRGFWCNDPDAILDFQRHLKKSFRSIKKLNERWGTNYASFEDVKPFLKKDAPSRRAMVDMVYRYRASMLGARGILDSGSPKALENEGYLSLHGRRRLGGGRSALH